MSLGPEPGTLAVARTFDPNWHATIDGRFVLVLRAEVRYETAFKKWMALVSIVSALLTTFPLVKGMAKKH